jgi:SAM-dependent methyltransferase
MAVGELLDRWRRDLEAWMIPAWITDAAAESPWVLPRQVFIRRADQQLAAPGGRSFQRAWEALEPFGSVLDVGAGAGAASLPLASRVTALTAVDTDVALLEELTGRAGRLGLPTRVVQGMWPEVAASVRPADVVVCHHVLFNVAELAPFIAALTGHARRRVVVELTARHPLAALNPLWARFHGLRRPQGPTADDALAILHALALDARAEAWQRLPVAEHERFEQLVEVTRRRLCLPRERADEVAVALGQLGIPADRPPDLGSSGFDLVTLWWPGTAPGP